VKGQGVAYWLIKSEPSTWGWDAQVARGAKGEPWTGVRNHAAKLNLMKMKTGDRAFFYHSVDEKRIAGIVEVIREHYPDPTDESGKFVVVDVKAVEPFGEPVTLADIKAEPRLQDMVLLKQSRLSVQPVADDEWKIICRMGGVKA
jgi:predicted RNA-binding protein with PUA-like domain